MAIDAETASLSPIGKCLVLNLEGAVVIIGDTSYRVVPVGEESDQPENVRELSVDEIRATLNELADNDDFQSIVNMLATKTEREHPGQDIEYVVVNDKRSSRDRVALAHEDARQYHPSDYETELVRAVESIISPLGWDRSDIRQQLADTRPTKITSF